jgi:hypothetical protein
VWNQRELLLFVYSVTLFGDMECLRIETTWPYKPEPDGSVNQMTVFGFGRPGWLDPKQHTPPLEILPARFSISLTTRTAAAALVRTLSWNPNP